MGTAKHKQEDSNKIDFKAIRWKGVNWTHLTQDRNNSQALVNIEMYLLSLSFSLMLLPIWKIGHP
jgi:hypothetical protein